MCGEWGASRCSPKKWFEFMGDAAGNLYVPFQITYITEPVDDFIPLDPKIVPCNEAINVRPCNTLYFTVHFLTNITHIFRIRRYRVPVSIAKNLVRYLLPFHQSPSRSPYLAWTVTKFAWLFCLLFCQRYS